MKKPHEQEWTKDEHQMGRINATDAICLEVRVAFWRVPEGDKAAMQQAQDVVDFALAAPDMARALMELADTQVAKDGLPCWCWEGEHVESTVRSCHRVRQALRKAGVL